MFPAREPANRRIEEQTNTMNERTMLAELMHRGVIQCGECGAYALAEDRFCACCGVRLPEHPRGEVDDSAENFCPRCGHRLREEH